MSLLLPSVSVQGRKVLFLECVPPEHRGTSPNRIRIGLGDAEGRQRGLSRVDDAGFDPQSVGVDWERILRTARSRWRSGPDDVEVGPPGDVTHRAREVWPFASLWDAPQRTTRGYREELAKALSGTTSAVTIGVSLSMRDVPAHISRAFPVEYLPIRGIAGLSPVHPACEEENILVLRQDPEQPSLVPTDRLRVLVTWNTPPGSDSNSGVLDTFNKKLKELCTANPDAIERIDVLREPDWQEVKRALTDEDRDYNVVVMAGHVHADHHEDAIDGVGYQVFKGAYDRGKSGAEQSESCVSAFDLAAAVRASGEVRACLLLGCSTWTRMCGELQSPAAKTAATPTSEENSSSSGLKLPEIDSTKPVPFVVGTHHTIHLEAPWRDAIVDFVEVLAATRHLDEATLAMRRGGSDEVRSALAASVHGTRFDVLAEGNIKDRIQYARHVLSDLGRMTLADIPLDDTRSDPNRSWGIRIRRRLLREVPVAQTAAEQKDAHGQDQPKGPEYELVPQSEAWLLDCIRAASHNNSRLDIGIEAEAGAGKSTLLKYIARTLAQEVLANPDPDHGNVLLPVWCELRNAQGSTHDLEGIAKDAVDAVSGFASRCVLLLDGLDEFSGSIRWNEVPALACVTVLSSRPETARTSRSQLPHFREQQGLREHILRLEAISGPQIDTYIKDYFDSAAADRPQDDRRLDERRKLLVQALQDAPDIKRVLAEPLLLNLLILLYEEGEDTRTLPETATQLIDRALRHIIQRRNSDCATARERLFDPEHLDFLAALAFEETLRLSSGTESPIDRTDIPGPSAEAIVANALDRCKHLRQRLTHNGHSLAAWDQLDLMRRRSGLLDCRIVSGANRYFIRDVRFREFLTARHLNRLLDEHGWHGTGSTPCIYDPDKYREAANGPSIKKTASGHQPPDETVGQFVSRKAWDDVWWRRVLVHLSALALDPHPLLSELLGGMSGEGHPTPANRLGDDASRWRLQLAREIATIAANQAPGKPGSRSYSLWQARLRADRHFTAGSLFDLSPVVLRSAIVRDRREGIALPVWLGDGHSQVKPNWAPNCPIPTKRSGLSDWARRDFERLAPNRPWWHAALAYTLGASPDSAATDLRLPDRLLIEHLAAELPRVHGAGGRVISEAMMLLAARVPDSALDDVVRILLNGCGRYSPGSLTGAFMAEFIGDVADRLSPASCIRVVKRLLLWFPYDVMPGVYVVRGCAPGPDHAGYEATHYCHVWLRALLRAAVKGDAETLTRMWSWIAEFVCLRAG